MPARDGHGFILMHAKLQIHYKACQDNSRCFIHGWNSYRFCHGMRSEGQLPALWNGTTHKCFCYQHFQTECVLSWLLSQPASPLGARHRMHWPAPPRKKRALLEDSDNYTGAAAVLPAQWNNQMIRFFTEKYKAMKVPGGNKRRILVWYLKEILTIAKLFH